LYHDWAKIVPDDDKISQPHLGGSEEELEGVVDGN
jgi:hypothetical protein